MNWLLLHVEGQAAMQSEVCWLRQQELQRALAENVGAPRSWKGEGATPGIPLVVPFATESDARMYLIGDHPTSDVHPREDSHCCLTQSPVATLV